MSRSNSQAHVNLAFPLACQGINEICLKLDIGIVGNLSLRPRRESRKRKVRRAGSTGLIWSESDSFKIPDGRGLRRARIGIDPA